MDNLKIVCEECGWCGPWGARLVAPNPFNPSTTIYGCPVCKGIDGRYVACDEDGCWEPVTCGTPTPEGYRSTCSKHRPVDAAKAPGGG